jgi:hypothetical protein
MVVVFSLVVDEKPDFLLRKWERERETLKLMMMMVIIHG